MTKDEVYEIAKEAFKEVCEINSIETDEEISLKMPIAAFAGNGYLDSLGLVNFIVAVEQRLADKGINIAIASEKAFSRRVSPFLNFELFVDFVYELINNQ